MRRIIVLLLAGMFLSAAPAQEENPAIPPHVARKALQWMQDPDPEKRQAAYRTFQLFGDEGGTIYRRTLTQARKIHNDKLTRILSGERTNPFRELPDLCETLKKERERIYQLIKTDFKKDPAKIAMLQREVESLSKLNEEARKLAQEDSSDLEKKISTTATALAEVIREIRIIDGEIKPAEKHDPEAALQDSYDGALFLKTKESIAGLKKEIAELEAAQTKNESSDWANPSQKAFASTLNGFRSLFNLTPLELEERLSEASVDHSKDMASIGFFAHESPVPGKKSPGDRAKKAGFQYAWTGENIFMGSNSPGAAYNAWFGSDGHRFIMFAKGPNLLGIGPHGRHWTMMTGRK